MATPVVTNTAKRPDQSAAPDAVVSIELVGEAGKRIDGYVSASDYTIYGLFKPTLNASTAVWSQALVPNSLITPSGSMYKVTTRIDGDVSVDFIVVTDVAGPLFVEDILEDGPPGPLPSNALKAHINDTVDAHDASAVSFDDDDADLGVSNAQAALDALAVTHERVVATWAAMQALSSPQDGATAYVLAQKINYRYEAAASKWVRRWGNIDEIWVTDHGGIGDRVADDSDAIDAANAEAVLTSEAPYSGRGAVVYFPRIGGSDANAGSYRITRTIERPVGVSWVGGNGRHAAQHSRSRPAMIDGTEVPSPDPAVIIGDGSSNAQWIHDRNIGIYGNNIALSIYRCSFVSSDYCWYAANEVAHAENAALRIENSFTLTFDHWNAVTGSTAHGQYAVRMVAVSDGGSLSGPIQGVANTTFRHGFMDLGGAVFENRTDVQGGDSECVVWEDVVTESHLGQPFFTYLGGGDAAHVLNKWKFGRCVRADSSGSGTGPSDSQTFIKLDANSGTGRISMNNPKIEGSNPYSHWLIQCVGATTPDVVNLDTDTAGTSGLVWDPSNEPFGRGRGLTWRGGSAALQLGSGGGGDTAVLNRTGGTLGTAISVGNAADSFQRAAWGGDLGDLVWGDGTSATPDTNLYRSAANVLKTDDKLLAALGIGVGNTAAATTPGTVTRKMEVFDASGNSLGFVAIYNAIT